MSERTASAHYEKIKQSTVRQFHGFWVLVVHISLLDCVSEVGLSLQLFADLLV